MFPTHREMRTCHISFLIRHGKIIHIGWNKYKTHTFNQNHPYRHVDCGLHAELDVCLKSGKEDLSDYELLVVRLNVENIFRNSRPCVGCQSVLRQFRIREVFYTNSLGIVEKMT
jgi:deoxycytidylate deaminase